ncbi:MAG: hypothetical protein M1828_002638 [Chrysothrix sp. TS-e1954]|nr:MAG: hypothetical protein M1828_002638 [Chrysothrix sp. TS-e1954]
MRRRGKFEDVEFVFPSAPNIPITVNFGMKMPGWYDITNFDTLNRSDDEPGISNSRSQINTIISKSLSNGIPPSRIILGGFSQGAALSMLTGLTFPQHRLGGIFALSGYGLMPSKFDGLRQEARPLKDVSGKSKEEAIKEDAKKEIVFMGHGKSDPLVKVEWGRMTRDFMNERGFNVTWKEYDGLEHSASPQELDDLQEWVEARLDASEQGGSL